MNQPDHDRLAPAVCCAWCRCRRCPGCGVWLKPLPFVRPEAPTRCPECGADTGEARPRVVTHGICPACSEKVLAAEGLR